MKKVSIVIVNWNNYVDTFECIESIYEIDYKNIEIIVVDNGSTDGSYQKLLSSRKIDILLRSAKNVGFSAGHNIGIKRALVNGADYVMIINNDTVVAKDFLSEMVLFMDRNSDAGVVGGKIYYHSHPNTIWTIGGDVSLFRGGSVYYGNKQEDVGQYENVLELTHISGCLSMVRSEVFKEVGLLSEQYFFRGEEWDFCYRVKHSKYKMFYIPTSKIWHKVSKSVVRFSMFDIYCAYRAKIIFINNFMPKPFNYIWIKFFYIYAMFISVNKFQSLARSRGITIKNKEILKHVMRLVFLDGRESDKVTLKDIEKIRRLDNE
jgi:GT2 family glycosyltransferase